MAEELRLHDVRAALVHFNGILESDKQELAQYVDRLDVLRDKIRVKQQALQRCLAVADPGRPGGPSSSSPLGWAGKMRIEASLEILLKREAHLVFMVESTELYVREMEAEVTEAHAELAAAQEAADRARKQDQRAAALAAAAVTSQLQPRDINMQAPALPAGSTKAQLQAAMGRA